MGTVQAQAIMSLDGYIAKQDNTIGRLFDWLQNGEVAIPTPAGDFTVHLTPPSAEHWRRWGSSLGALVCGRTLFEVAEGCRGPPRRPLLIRDRRGRGCDRTGSRARRGSRRRRRRRHHCAAMPGPGAAE